MIQQFINLSTALNGNYAYGLWNLKLSVIVTIFNIKNMVVKSISS
mgnify:CR=1 FL=1